MASAITKIAELNGTNSSSVISFTSISSTYKDLMFFGSLRNFASGTSYSHQEVKINFNGNTGTNYWDAYSYQRDNTIRYQMYTSGNSLRPIVCTTSSGSTTAYGTFRLFCPGYRDASLYKRFDILGAAHQTSNGMQNTIQSNSGWEQYSAITQVDFTNILANTFTTDSRISLYGIK